MGSVSFAGAPSATELALEAGSKEAAVRCASLEAKLAESTKTIEGLRAELAKKETDLSAVREESVGRVLALQADLAKANKTIKDIGIQLSVATTHAHSMGARLKEAERNLDDARAEFSRELGALRSQLEIVVRQRNYAQDELGKMTGELDRVCIEATRLKADLADSIKERDAARERARFEEMAHKNTVRTIQAGRASNEREIWKVREKMGAQLVDAHKERDEARAELAAVIRERDEARAALSNAKFAGEQVVVAPAAADSVRQDLEAQIKERDDKIAALTQERDEAKETVVHTQLQMDDLVEKRARDVRARNHRIYELGIMNRKQTNEIQVLQAEVVRTKTELEAERAKTKATAGPADDGAGVRPKVPVVQAGYVFKDPLLSKVKDTSGTAIIMAMMLVMSMILGSPPPPGATPLPVWGCCALASLVSFVGFMACFATASALDVRARWADDPNLYAFWHVVMGAVAMAAPLITHALLS
jgi:chromosome segregation ATPase